jgi:hypothetical protein
MVYNLDRVFDQNPFDEVFDFDDNGRRRFINASAVRRLYETAPKAFQKIRVEITDELFSLVLLRRGVEEWKVKRLPRKVWLNQPVMGIFLNDACDLYVAIDGNHRIVKRYRAGLRYFDMAATVPELWRKCLVFEFLTDEEAYNMAGRPSVEEGPPISSRASVA